MSNFTKWAEGYFGFGKNSPSNQESKADGNPKPKSKSGGKSLSASGARRTLMGDYRRETQRIQEILNNGTTPSHVSHPHPRGNGSKNND